MKDKDLNNLARLVKKAGSYKPENKPLQPSNPPSKDKLEEKYKLDLKTLRINKG